MAKGQKGKNAKGQKGKRAKVQGQIRKVNREKLGKVLLSEIRRLSNSSHVWGMCNQCIAMLPTQSSRSNWIKMKNGNKKKLKFENKRKSETLTTNAIFLYCETKTSTYIKINMTSVFFEVIIYK